MAPKVLVSDKLSETAVQIFRDRGVEVDFLPDLGKDKARLLEVIGEYDKTAVHVIGHTDSTGTDSYNQSLSEKRATSVSRLFSANGVDLSRMRYSGRGEELPVATNSTSSGRSMNRRVEVYLKPFVEGHEEDAFSSPI